MKNLSSLHLLAALGALGAAAGASAQVDTSQWKCTSCPYPKGTTGSVDAGVGYVSDSSKKFGDYTGLDEKGAFLDLGGNVSHRGENGYFADLWGADLGLDSRRLYGQAGREGRYSLNVGYAEIPRHLTEGARTPFLGIGGSLLTLPPGFPAADTTSMPLASTLQPIDIGLKFKRLDLGGTFIGEKGWSANLSLRHDERDGTRPVSGSFLSTASQFAAPVNEKTDGAELTVAYATKQLQATVSYLFSSFRNDDTGVTWSNPFFPVVPGATSGQLGLAPDNQFQQLRGTAAYDISPTMRVSGEAAWGQMTQNDGFLAPTVNAVLAPTVPPLPANSLDGKIDTFTANVKMTATPMQGLRVTGSYDRDSRENKTPVRSYPTVVTDMAVGTTPRNNTPFSFTLDRFKLIGDYSGGLPNNTRLTGGAEYDMRERTYQEVVTTREMTLWGKFTAQPTEKLSTLAEVRVLLARQLHLWDVDLVRLPGKPAAAQVLPGRPPAQHDRGSARLRVQREDLGRRLGRLCRRRLQPILGRPHLGAQRQYRRRARDRLHRTDPGPRLLPDPVGPFAAERQRSVRRARLDRTHEGHVRRARARRQARRDPEQARHRRRLHGLALAQRGRGRQHPRGTALPDRADEARGPQAVRDLQPEGQPLDHRQLSLRALRHTDWRLDGIAPGTVSNLLALGAQPPNYSVNVFRVAMRYRF